MSILTSNFNGEFPNDVITLAPHREPDPLAVGGLEHYVGPEMVVRFAPLKHIFTMFCLFLFYYVIIFHCIC